MKRFAVMALLKRSGSWCVEYRSDDLNDAYTKMRKLESSHENTCDSKCSYEWKVIENEV